MIQLWKRWLATLRSYSYPRRLRLRGRAVLPCSAFRLEDKLYHGFSVEDLDDLDNIKIETIRFPDFSCNWARFSIAADVRLRENGQPTDGAYAFTVETARYKSLATPVHDPLRRPVENYAHVEVRELQEEESVLEAPPKNRKKKKSGKSRRLEYRQNLLNQLSVELPAESAAI
jgi:hypothetical protein